MDKFVFDKRVSTSYWCRSLDLWLVSLYQEHPTSCYNRTLAEILPKSTEQLCEISWRLIFIIVFYMLVMIHEVDVVSDSCLLKLPKSILYGRKACVIVWSHMLIVTRLCSCYRHVRMGVFVLPPTQKPLPNLLLSIHKMFYRSTRSI